MFVGPILIGGTGRMEMPSYFAPTRLPQEFKHQPISIRFRIVLGDPFRDCRDSEGRPGDWLQNDRDSERSAGNRWYGGLDCLQALQHDAGKLGATLLAASLTLFVGASALDGAPDVVWEVSLGLLVVIFVGGVVALCYAYRAQTRRAPHNNEIELAPLLGGTAGV